MKIKFLLLALFPLAIFSQTPTSKGHESENYITTDILSPFYFHYYSDYYTPRWRLGYVNTLNEKSKIGVSFGFGNANTSLLTTGTNYFLWEIRPEYYRILNPNKKTLKYFAVELFYINHKEKFTNQSFFDKDYNYLTFEKADYNRKKFGIIPKLGLFMNLSNRIGLNLYTGVGIRCRINSYNNFVNLRTAQYDEEHNPPYYRNEGNKIGAEFTMGIKLFYRIKNKQ